MNKHSIALMVKALTQASSMRRMPTGLVAWVHSSLQEPSTIGVMATMGRVRAQTKAVR